MTTGVDVSDLGRLTATDGPYLSAYLPTEGIEREWTALRASLLAGGAPETALGLVDALVANRGDRVGTVAVVTDATNVLVEEYLIEPMIYGRGTWGPAPDLVPIIKDRQEQGAEAIEDDDARRAIKTEVADETVDILERFQSPGDDVVEGISATVDALNRAVVEVLVVRDDRDERRNLPREDAEVIDALVRDAIATGASVRVIPASGPVTDGVGALLRQS